MMVHVISVSLQAIEDEKHALILSLHANVFVEASLCRLIS